MPPLAGPKSTWNAQKLTRVRATRPSGRKIFIGGHLFSSFICRDKLSAFWRFSRELLTRTPFRRVLVVKRGDRGPRGFTESVCERFRRRKTENRVAKLRVAHRVKCYDGAALVGGAVLSLGPCVARAILRADHGL